MRVRVSRRAAREIRDARAWWREHRPAAPNAFPQDVRKAIALLRSSPRVGNPLRQPSRGVRRVHLGRIRYDLYYRIREDGSAVEILALWHSSRGRVPL